jgi:hypothetical protein
MAAADVAVELPKVEFEANWRRHYDAVFVDRDIDKQPFRQVDWRQICLGAPAYYFDDQPRPLAAQQVEHRSLYSAVERAISAVGDDQIIGFLRNGPYSNPSIFRGLVPFARAMYQMRSKAVDGFDLNVFGASESWGIVISWEEEIALVGGSSQFIDVVEQVAGGRSAVRRNFEWATAYLQEIGDEQRELVSRLRSVCFSG